MSQTAVQIPGYVAGVWDIDPVHPDATFTVRH
jgi:polyisoprenoid-binding protein YceI